MALLSGPALAQEAPAVEPQAPTAVPEAPEAAAFDAAGRERLPACARITVSSPQQPRQGRGFSASGIVELEFEAAVHGRYLSQDHLLELKLYTPRGHLYQVLPVPFTLTLPARDEASQEVRVDRRRRPMRRRHTRQREVEDGVRHSVSASIPVAGSWIVTNSLYGAWRVDAYLDGSENRCGSRRFRLVQ